MEWVSFMISVCLATFNGERFIEDQLYSILKQLNHNDEVIISDDFSSDRTVSIVNAINDKRIKVILNKLQRGYTGNFENAMRYASGDTIFLSDQDDVWLDGKVEIMIDKLINSDFVVSDAKVVNEDLLEIYKSIFKLRKAKSGFLTNLLQIKYLGCCIAFKRIILDMALPFPKKHTLITHDSWLTLIAELYFRVSIVTFPLILYRRHENNISNGGMLSENSLAKKLSIRIYALYSLFSIFPKFVSIKTRNFNY